MTEAEQHWTPVCVLCAGRGKATRLDAGHCCVACAAWLSHCLAEIITLAADASAWIEPGASTGSSTTAAYGSRPPLNLDALDPELACVPMYDGQPLEEQPALLVVLEGWQRMIRQDRGMSPYGPATEHANPTTFATLTECCRFLGRQVPWMVDATDFPLEDFAGEIQSCLRAVRRWDTTRSAKGIEVTCPTITDEVDDEGEPVACGARLRVHVWLDVDGQEQQASEDVTCRRCRVTRDASQLLYAAGGDDAYADAEAISQRLRVDESTIRRWARSGKVARKGQRYRFGDVREMVDAMRGRRAG